MIHVPLRRSHLRREPARPGFSEVDSGATLTLQNLREQHAVQHTHRRAERENQQPMTLRPLQTPGVLG